LGNGGSPSGNSPSPVTPSFGFTPSATTISAGQNYSQVLMANGVLYGFGENGLGQLGIGNTTDQLTPVVSASSLSGSIADVACGYTHTLCILANGEVRAWGFQFAGALGNDDGSFAGVSSPVTPHFGFTPTATTISAGVNYSQVLMANGVLYGFGENSSGQLGIGNTTDQLTPVVSASSLSGSIADVACSRLHTLCILSNGEVRAWGQRTYGALGDGNISGSATTPVIPSFGFTPTATTISGGNLFSQVLMSNGTRYAFGTNITGDDTYGQLGIGTTASSQTTPLAGVTVNGTGASLSKIYPSPQFNQGYWYQEYSGDTTFLQKYQTT